MAFKMKGSAFKLNNVATKSALKQSEVSPMKQKNFKNKKEARKYDADITKIHSGITSDMTKEELRQYVIANNQGGGEVISQDEAIRAWRAKGGTVAVEPEAEVEEVAPVTDEERKRYYYADTAKFRPSSEGGYQPLSDERTAAVEESLRNPRNQ